MKTWEQAWLAYEPLNDDTEKDLFQTIYVGVQDAHTEAALEEFSLATERLFGIRASLTEKRECAGIRLELAGESQLGEEGYELIREKSSVTIRANRSKGLLYGAFRLLLLTAAGKRLQNGTLREIPQNPLRMINHWDNLDGSIERGYAGKSFFFTDGQILETERMRDYARLLCSTGINGIVLNNVNVRYGAERLITAAYYQRLAEVTGMFGRYGITVYLSIDFAAPITAGGLESADPLKEETQNWWAETCRNLFQAVPNLGGFLVKADSEGRPGPYAYGRNHADGANMLARAVKPWGGIIIWRCFVYNCRQDWRDRKMDRARAAYENFLPLDGSFDENVILQIKNGPMDFQIREPVNPLFGRLNRTNQMLEVQIAQEYTGQQIDVCYLVPLWKEVLAFSTGCQEADDTVADIVSGRTFGQHWCGMAGVSNTGDDPNWTGSDLAAANLFGFGRLAWNPDRDASDIAAEWAALQLGRDENIIRRVSDILLHSREIYEKYTTPMGIGFMVNPSHHYGPNPEGYEYSSWGTYHRADHLAIGVERGPDGTGYSELYFEKHASQYRDVYRCPGELLLFFHRVPYTHRMPDGRTLIQCIYDSHFEGFEQMVQMEWVWDSLEGRISPVVFQRVKERFALQEANAREWRDVINSFFYRKSMIADEKGREIY
ncbi:MAG: alpha-glucuronidase [Clostridiales bacterium]|nr:alpha-glucuronidase [Clostridiales bacterium]